jgi:putative membrane protein
MAVTLCLWWCHRDHLLLIGHASGKTHHLWKSPSPSPARPRQRPGDIDDVVARGGGIFPVPGDTQPDLEVDPPHLLQFEAAVRQILRPFRHETDAKLTAVALLSTTSVLAQSQPTAMGDAEEKHAEDTKKTGSLSLATSRLASEKASDELVKAFSKWEVAEQETIADILKSVETGAKAEGALKPPSDEEVAKVLDAEAKASLDKLKAASGAEFDKAYLAAQLDGHSKLLTIQEDYLKVGRDREHLNVTKLARGQIKEHIDHLEMLKSELG